MRRFGWHGVGGCLRFIAGFLEPLLLLLQRLNAFPELVERARYVAFLRVPPEIQCFSALLLQERQLDVVGEEEQGIGVRHGGVLHGLKKRMRMSAAPGAPEASFRKGVGFLRRWWRGENEW